MLWTGRRGFLAQELFGAPAYADTSASAPFDLGLKIFVLVLEINLERIRDRNAVPKPPFWHPLDVASRTMQSMLDSLLLKIDAALEERLMADKSGGVSTIAIRPPSLFIIDPET